MSHQKVCIRGVAGSDLPSKMIPLAVEEANEVGKVLDGELGLYGRAGTGVRQVGCPGACTAQGQVPPYPLCLLSHLGPGPAAWVAAVRI